MLKTNSKQARENVRNYVLAHFEPYAGDEVNLSNFKYVSQYIYKCVYVEKIKHDNRHLSFSQYFEEWCAGLPSVLDTCYYYKPCAVSDLGDILEESEEERNKYTESEAEKMLTHLIFMEIERSAFS